MALSKKGFMYITLSILYFSINIKVSHNFKDLIKKIHQFIKLIIEISNKLII